jgi:lipopolysaccharide export system protein LptA
MMNFFAFMNSAATRGFSRSLRLLAACICLGSLAHAQQTAPADTTKKIRVETSMTAEYFQLGDTYLQKLKENVRLRQGNTLVYCDTAVLNDAQNKAVLQGDVVFEQGDSLRAFGDSAIYFGNTRQVDLFGHAVLVRGQQELYTEKLHYDLENKIATYHNGATLSNGKSQLSSQHGYYHVAQNQVYFRGDVIVTDPEYTLRSDTMSFNTVTQTVQFLAPTRITQRDSRLYTEGGYYDLKNNNAVFDKNPQYEREQQRGRAEVIRYNGTTKTYQLEGQAHIVEPERLVEADTIIYHADTEQAVLIGHAHYKDSTQDITGAAITYDGRNKRYQLAGRGRVSDPPNIIEANTLDFNDVLGNGLAEGDVIWQDTTAKTILLAARIDYNKQSDFIQAFGGFGNTRRPLLKSLLDNDTLYLSADTLTSFRPDTASDHRLLLAYRDVRIFKSDMQALCDSLSYHGADSIFWLFKIDSLPIVWSDTSQFTADTILIGMKNSKIDRIWLRQNAFMLNSPDEQLFNQIKGRDCTAFFRDNKIQEMLVEGNAQALYYTRNEDDEYVGLNETFCAEMRMFFSGNQVDGIRFYTEPSGKFTPMGKAGAKNRKLEGFFWETSRRPKGVDDLY